jgi:hypothetical protein
VPRPDLPTADECEKIFHAALGQGDVKGVHAALLILAVQDPRRAEALTRATRTTLSLIEAVDSGRLGITRDDLRDWARGDRDALGEP